MAKIAWAFALVILVPWQDLTAKEVQLGERKFTIPDGLELVVAAEPPIVDRPVSMDFDEAGRLYVSDSSGSNDNVQVQLKEKPHRILRLEDTDGDGRFDHQQVFADKMMFPEGVLWYDGSLYVAAPPSIWKLTDTDGDGVADRRDEWFAGKTLTGCANDLHGPYLGPDGWIYWCKGAFAEQTYERPGQPPLVTRAAHIFRRRPEGGPIEPVMTGGMDNPVEVAFTPGGERIFTTTFLQHPRGGRRDGLIHAIYGGVYGKQHGVIDGHPRTGDLMPVMVHLGAAAPCGLTRLESTTLGPTYQNSMLTTCFNMHKVTRHALSPSGATFAASEEEMLVCDDLDFHPTDVVEDADGSVLVVDTGGWYKLCCPTSQLHKPDVLGAIYRIRRVDGQPAKDPRGLGLDWPNLDADELAQLLRDGRSAVRERAKQTLAKQGAEAAAALDRLLQSPHSDANNHRDAVWALCRIDHPAARIATRRALVDADEQVRQAAIHAVGIWRDRGATPHLVELLENSSHHNRRAAAEALGRIGDTAGVAALLAAIDLSNDRVLDHSLVYALIETADPAATRSGLADADSWTRRAALLALDQMPAGGLRPEEICPLLASPDAILRNTAAFIVDQHADWGEHVADYLRQRLGETRLTEADLDQLADQLLRFAGDATIQKLMVDALTSENNTLAAKQCVLRAMAGSRPSKTPAVWTSGLHRLLEEEDGSLVSAVVKTLAALPVAQKQDEEEVNRLLAVARAPRFDVGVRLAALECLSEENAKLDPDIFAFVLSQLPVEQDVDQRTMAARVLARGRLTSEQLVRLADGLATTGPMELDRVLSAFQEQTNDDLGLRIAAALRLSPAVEAVPPERLEALFLQFSPHVQEASKPLFATLELTVAEKQERLEELLATLSDGDVRRGQRVFQGSKAACSACHSMGYLGGEIGPDLTRIAGIRSVRDLLEAVLYPSSSFVRSFEPVIAVTVDGIAVHGIIVDDTQEDLILGTADKELQRVPKADIEEILPGKVSVMPAGLDKLLTRQELADLMAFLQTAQ